MKIEKHQWVRIKTGLYSGDLGLVECTAANNKVWLRIIPRVEFKPKTAADAKSSRFSTIRLPQKGFSIELIKGQQHEIRREKDILNKEFIYFKRNFYRKSFLYKQFSLKQLDID